MQTHPPSPNTRGRLAPAPESGDELSVGSPAGASSRLLAADDVAVVLGVPRTFVYALARRGALPTVRIGERYVRFRAEALQEWIAAQETPSARRHR